MADEDIVSGVSARHEAALYRRRKLQEDKRKRTNERKPLDKVELAKTFTAAETRVKAKEMEQKAMIAAYQSQQAALRKRNKDLQEIGPRIAQRRLKDKKKREQIQLVNRVEKLIEEQDSSIKAMNVARLISPRFEEKFVFQRYLSDNSSEDVRLKTILRSDIIGNFEAGGIPPDFIGNYRPKMPTEIGF